MGWEMAAWLPAHPGRHQPAIAHPIDSQPTPHGRLRLDIRSRLCRLTKTHLLAALVYSRIPQHVNVNGNELADALAEGPVLAVGKQIGKQIAMQAARQKCAAAAQRGKRTPSFQAAAAAGCTSDGASEEEEDDNEGWLTGPRAREQPATPPRPDTIADSSGLIPHGRLLPCSVLAAWQACKRSLEDQWTTAWRSSKTGGHLRAFASANPSKAFERFLGPLANRQSIHFGLSKASCACGNDIETRKHLLLHCPLYVLACQSLRVQLKHKPLPLAYPLGNPNATKATRHFLGDTARFDSLYSPPRADANATRTLSLLH